MVKSIFPRQSEKVICFLTEKGSVYSYLPNGKVQRFKTSENLIKTPYDITVFIPDFDWLVRNGPKEKWRQYAKNPLEYSGNLTDYAYANGRKLTICDRDGNKTLENSQLNTEKDRFVAFCRQYKDSVKVDFHLPVSRFPQLGFRPYEFSYSQINKNGEAKKEHHLGHSITSICFDSGWVRRL